MDAKINKLKFEEKQEYLHCLKVVLPQDTD